VPRQICSSFCTFICTIHLRDEVPITSPLEVLVSIKTVSKSNTHATKYPRGMKEEFLLLITHAFLMSCSFTSESSHSWTLPADASDLISRTFYVIRCHGSSFSVAQSTYLPMPCNVTCHAPQHSHHLYHIETFIRLCNLPTLISFFPL
jgi:hypothetical protein